ncbi:ABC transporter ATP-binding protein [Brevibacillus ruminantium]|uniref:ABC transporter ATP-binding protein n=1 Tax=Brevibacillus ruminantium TaxID=2950604 RepID=A0ABY4WI49_9BACL|nr:ABC transporter ATP-binding protein [Brevibacillus ruminantium]USG65702.1 ABC transporter ATP-binding protein [Brevibacillus ruminantium]
MKPVLEVKGLKKDLGAFALKDVSFSLLEGCITGFIGVNGAGKTTTIKSILGLIGKDAGEILFYGKEIESVERDFKNRIGIVLDEGYFYEDLTLLDMKRIMAPAYAHWDEALFQKYMKDFDLPAGQQISTLSKGMRMKYAIALAMSHHPDLLIMDEPTSGLDPQVRMELMDILLAFIKQEGKSVFFSSHITSDLDKVADMLIFIENGRIILSEEKDVLLDRHCLVKGDRKELNEHTRGLFLTLHETDYGFSGLTDNKTAVRQQMGNVIVERPAIEDVMLAYIRR